MNGTCRLKKKEKTNSILYSPGYCQTQERAKAEEWVWEERREDCLKEEEEWERRKVKHLQEEKEWQRRREAQRMEVEWEKRRKASEEEEKQYLHRQKKGTPSDGSENNSLAELLANTPRKEQQSPLSVTIEYLPQTAATPDQVGKIILYIIIYI